MEKSNPKVSVIIPTYNRAHFVGRAIQSVMDQTYQDFEIIVVDDGSTDTTRDIIAPYEDRIVYLYQNNRGCAAARNKGIRYSRGEFIAFLDSDDLWLPKKLEEHVEIFKKNESISVIYSNCITIDFNDEVINGQYNQNQFISGHIFDKILLNKLRCFFLQSMLVRKKCFEEIGYFDEEFKKSSDREFVIRLAKNYKMYGIKEPSFIYRKHNQRISMAGTKVAEHYHFKLLDKIFKEYGKELDEKIKRRSISFYYCRAGLGYLLKEKDISLARKRFKVAILNNPFNFRSYIYIFSTLMGDKGLKTMLAIRKIILMPLHLFRKIGQIV